MRTIAIANCKGGVGKTSIAVHTAVGLARKGLRTLLVDLDFQAHASIWTLRWKERAGADVPGVARALTSGQIPPESLHPTEVKGLTVLPSPSALPAAEKIASELPAGQTHLRQALQGVRKLFDVVVIDSAPNLGTGVVSGLCASDAVFVPIYPSIDSLRGVRDLEGAVTRLRVGFHVATHICGYALWSVGAREGISEATRQRLRQHGEMGRLMASEIRVSTAAKWLSGNHRTAWDPGADPRGAEDYPPLLEEMLHMVWPVARKGAR